MVEKLVTTLEMRAPEQLRPAAPVAGLRLARLADPAGADAARVRELHDAIATPHLWSSLARSDEQWHETLADPKSCHWVATANGTDIGWANLAVGGDGSVEIVSFGLRPETVGAGYGGGFLTAVVRQAWQLHAGPDGDETSRPRRVWLHTSSWDHPHALANYLARGFRVGGLAVQQQPAGSGRRVTTPVDRAPGVLVRPAVPPDAPSVSELLAALGYQRPAEAVRQRLGRLASSPHDLVAVAVEDGTDIRGVIAGHVVPMFAEADPAFLRVTALSVAPDAVRRGHGRRLVDLAEHFARLHGCRLIEVSSGRREEREPAHRFYRALGFEDTADSAVRYWRPLEADTK